MDPHPHCRERWPTPEEHALAIAYTSSYTGGVPTLKLDRATHALTDPTRRRILEIVRAEEKAAGAIAAHFDVSRPAISQHLGVLRDAGLVSTRRAGRQHLYRARPEGLTELHEWMGRFWTSALDDLRVAAESEHRVRTRQGEGQ